jgi:hypothetical protein
MADTAFSDEQFDKIYPPGVERHYWNRCRNRVIERALRRSGAEGPLLEVGCGKGLVVHYLRAQGFDIHGVELAPVTPLAGMEAYVRTGLDVMALEDAEAVRYRTVLLLDVIEHLPDPSGFVAMVRRKFPHVENILVTVPARQELFSDFDRFNGHFRRYDGQAVKAHLAGPGVRELQWSYVFHALYPVVRLQLASKGQREMGFTSPRGPLWQFAHVCIGAFLYLDHLLLPSRWKGTSIIAVAKGRNAAGRG